MSSAFLEHRPMLYGLAYRLLGGVHDAEDVLQEAYLRWTRADRSDVAEPRRYLTRVVARLAVDLLRARQARREQYVGTWLPEPVATPLGSTEPSPFAAVDTSELSIAVLHLMERLTPPQRAVYVLRTAFELPYPEIAAILDRGVEDCRQLYHRAVAALGGRPRFSTDPAEHGRLLDGFVAAARRGDVAQLERLLHQDVVAWSDGGGKVQAARNPILGRAKVMRFFTAVLRRAPECTTVGANGTPGILVAAPDPWTLHAAVVDGRIRHLYIVRNPEKLSTFAATPSIG